MDPGYKAAALLKHWHNLMPPWAQEAYFNDPTINKLLHECALAQLPTQEMIWKLAEVLFKQRNNWSEKHIEYVSRNATWPTQEMPITTET